MYTKLSSLTILLFTIMLMGTGCEKPLFCEGGKGPEVTRTLDLPPLTGIVLSDYGQVNLSQGETQSVTVTGQENIIDKLKLNIKDEVWAIGLEGCVKSNSALTFDITLPTLTEARINGSGNITGITPFTELDEVELTITGSGNMELDLTANSVDSRISGSGNMEVQLMTTTLNSDITGSGNMEYAGEANSHDIHISGSGDVHALEMPTATTEANITGSGNTRVAVNNTLKVDISGSGDVIYRGNPTIEVHITGSGTLRPE